MHKLLNIAHMYKKGLTKSIFYYFLFFFVIIFDQLIKYKIRLNGGFYICNQGISFGISINSYLYWLFFSVFLLLIIYLLFIKNALFKTFFVVGLILISAGAISNAADRLFIGCVSDYIHIFSNFFPIFNLADISIFVGSIFLAHFLFKKNNTNCE